MLKKVCTLSCLSFAALGLISLPAQADTAVIQSTTNEAYVGGTNNRASQVSEQYNRIGTRGKKDNPNDTGIIQEAYQGVQVDGEGNQVEQRSQQRNIIQNQPGKNRRQMRIEQE
jgi:hypothetical protein